MLDLPEVSPEAYKRLSREDRDDLLKALDDKDILAARDDFLIYMERTWPEFIATPFHRTIAEALMAVERGEIRRLLIEAPVRHGKTWMCAKRFPLWYMARNPGHDAMLGCYGGDLAAESGRELRDLARKEKHLDIFPEARLSGSSQRVDNWALQTGGEFLGAGTGGPIMGRGFNLGILDDLLKGRAAADSELERNNVWRWYFDFLSRQQHPNAIVFVTARWSDDDPAGRIREQIEQGIDDWTIMTFQALDENDEALAPEVKPAEELKRTRRIVPARQWYSQYQSSPVADSGDFFRDTWFHPSPKRWTPEDAENGLIRTYGATDAAVSKGEGDFTVHIIVGVDKVGQIHVLDLWRQREDSAGWVDAMLTLQKKWKTRRWAQEGGQIWRAVEPLVRKRMLETGTFLIFEKIPVAKEKKVRAQSIQGYMELGMVFWPISADWYEIARSEMLRFDAGKNDDIVDAISLIGRMLAMMSKGRTPEPGPEAERMFTIGFDDEWETDGQPRETWRDLIQSDRAGSAEREKGNR